MKLGLLPEVPQKFAELSVEHLQSDSRLEIRPSTLFVASKGLRHDSHDAVLTMLERNKTLIACGERPIPHERYFQVKNSRRFYALAQTQLNGILSASMRVFGVTGTSGKTTTAWVLEHILKTASRPVGLIGTLCIRDSKFSESSEGFTSPPSEILQGVLRRFHQDGVSDVVMEVSSHALSQHRVDGTLFNSVAFLNLSEEHLDFHPNMEEYYQAKRSLFFEQLEIARSGGKEPQAVVWVDSSWGQRLFDELVRENKTRVQGVGFGAIDERFRIKLIEGSRNAGVRFFIGSLELESPLIGQFNIENVAIASVMAILDGVPASKVIEAVRSLPSVPGRMERVHGPAGRVSPSVWVDYAHKPEALEKVLRMLRDERERLKSDARIVCVVGCGGDRDRSKRPKMARIAEAFADVVVLTSDNPRSEDPLLILREMEAGLKNAGIAKIIPDRAVAIETAIRDAHSKDWILIAGKGHETTQEIRGLKLPFDDREVAKRVLFGA